MQGVNVAELGIKYLGEVLLRYNGGCIYLAVYFACIIFLCVKGSKRDFKIFVPMTVLLLLTVYNPLFPLVLSKFADINSEYYRFLWITPIIVLVPYTLTKLIFFIKDNYKKRGELYLLVVIAVLIVLSGGKYLYSVTDFKLAENIYKVPNELIEVSEKLHEVSLDEYPKAYLEYEYNMQMRQYDPKILLTIDREDYIYAMTNPYSYEMIEDDTHPQYRILAALTRYQHVDMNRLCDAFDATQTEFVVLTKGSSMIDRLIERGLCEVAETENHVILKYDLIDKKTFELVDYSEVYEKGW